MSLRVILLNIFIVLMATSNSTAMANNLHHHQPPPDAVVVHVECLKNHAAALGGHALDGCGEFMPLSTAAPLTCAACGCHRNFHRRREVTEQRYPNFISFRHPTGKPSSSSTPPQQPRLLSLGPELTPVAGNPTKRFRSVFTKLQKERMRAFAETLGWNMVKCNQAAVENFCKEIGMTKMVFKIWIHNNKKKYAGRRVPGGGDAAGNMITGAGTKGTSPPSS